MTPRDPKAEYAAAKSKHGNNLLAEKRRWREQNKHKRRAHTKLRDALRNGRMKRPEQCSACGKVGSLEGHHEDYTRPLDVNWLCVSCHRRRHSKRGTAHPEAKLTIGQVIDIRARYSTGNITQRELAEAFGVGDTTISRAIIGKGWQFENAAALTKYQQQCGEKV